MKKIELNFKWLGNSRYSASLGHNVVQVNQESIVFASSYQLEPEMTYKYSDLIERLKNYFNLSDEVNQVSSSLQQFRNHLSALNGYLALCGKTVDANVGVEMGSQFESQIREYLSAIQVSTRTKQDRASQLKTIRRLFQELAANSKNPIQKDTNFTLALREAVAKSGLAPKTLAKQVGISPSTLSRWLSGASLNQRGYPSLHRLEKAFSLERGSLAELAAKEATQEEERIVTPLFRRRFAGLRESSLRLPESSLSDDFLDEWRQLFSYKTGSFSMLNRSPKGAWRLIPSETALPTTRLAMRRNMECPTAAIVLGYFLSFFGILQKLPANQGGLACKETPYQTLAWLAHPEALTVYLDWVTDRSEGIRHQGQKGFAQSIASLVRPETGYLWQQPEVFRNRLPEEFRPASDEEWRLMCEKSHDYLRECIRNSQGVSRSPLEPIANLLDSEAPLKPLLDAIKHIDTKAASCPPGGQTEARHKRDALLLALIISNPLRRRSIASLTWLPDGSGSLRGSSVTGWRIRLTVQQQKNGSSKRGRNYDVKVADWVKPRLDAYIEEYRDRLLKGMESPYLFIGSKTGNIWQGITSTVLKLTRRHIPGSPGFGPHGVRHIVATDWLRRYPGDYLTVAELLNDRIETVIAEYAHLKRDDSFSRYEEHVSKFLS